MCLWTSLRFVNGHNGCGFRLCQCLMNSNAFNLQSVKHTGMTLIRDEFARALSIFAGAELNVRRAEYFAAAGETASKAPKGGKDRGGSSSEQSDADSDPQANLQELNQLTSPDAMQVSRHRASFSHLQSLTPFVACTFVSGPCHCTVRTVRQLNARAAASFATPATPASSTPTTEAATAAISEMGWRRRKFP